jgi:hypothetical protein
MEDLKKQQIAQAALERFPDASTIFITTDEQAFDDAGKAIAAAVALSSGNPQVHEVAVKGLQKVAPLVKLTKAQTIEKATKQLADMKAIVSEKQAAYDNAEGNKKGAAKNALNKALSNEQAAQTALDLANELPDDTE